MCLTLFIVKEYPFFSTLFVEKTLLSLLIGSFVKNQLTVKWKSISGYFIQFHGPQCLSTIPHCPDFCSFMVGLE